MGGGVAIVVSRLWGVLIFRDLPSSLWMSILSLLILIVGGFVIAFCDKIGKYMQPSNSSAESEPLLDTSMNHVDEVDSMSKVFRGVSLSIIVGLTGGSILVPLHYVSESKQGILFLPSFGIGSLLILLLYIVFILSFLDLCQPFTSENLFGQDCCLFFCIIWVIFFSY